MPRKNAKAHRRHNNVINHKIDKSFILVNKSEVCSYNEYNVTIYVSTDPLTDDDV